MDIFDREAIGIRGRFGVDVWERWLSFQHSQEDFLRNYGVREDRIDGTVLALKRLLRDEGIMADKNYHRANRKRANDLFDRLFSSPGVFSVGSSGDIMAYVDLPSDQIPSGGTHFYWVVIDSNGDEIVGGATSSFEEAKSLAENNLFRLSRELYPESYTSSRRRAYKDDTDLLLGFLDGDMDIDTFGQLSSPGQNLDRLLLDILDSYEARNVKDLIDWYHGLASPVERDLLELSSQGAIDLSTIEGRMAELIEHNLSHQI